MSRPDPFSLLDRRRSESSNRKLYLLGCAAYRLQWGSLEAKSRRVVQLCERYADGAATIDEVAAAAKGIIHWDPDVWEETWSGNVTDVTDAFAFAKGALGCFSHDWGFFDGPECRFISKSVWQARIEAHAAKNALLTELIHCVLRNSFHDVAIEQDLPGPAVLDLARRIYDEQVFEQLPVLARALRGAGWTHPEILDHCDLPGPHARGCWVIDGILDYGAVR
jgi:hypothetical protein